MKIGGLDIGSTGCKLTVFDDSGIQLGQAYRDYPVKRQLSSHEIDISAMMDSVRAVTREMADQFPDLTGIGVTSFGETFVMADENGEPLRPAMMYTDPRGEEECRELCDRLGLLVWEEPLSWGNRSEELAVPRFLDTLAEQVELAIRTSFNNP